MVPVLSTQRRWPLRWWDSNHQQPWVLILNRHYSIPKRWSSVMWLYKWTFPSQITPIKLSTMRPRKISCTWEAGRNKSYTSTFHLGIMNSRNNDLKRDCTGVWPQNIRSRRRNLPPRRRESYPVHTRKTINDSMLRAYFRLCRKLQWWGWNKTSSRWKHFCFFVFWNCDECKWLSSRYRGYY